MKAIVWICLVLAVACAVSGVIVDPDLWWHIVVGRWIIAHQAFPVVDHWNLFGISTPWYAYSWLFEVAVAPIDRYAGDRGLLVAQVLLLAMFCAVLCYSYRQLSRSWFSGTYLGVMATLALTQHFTLRPQAIVWGLEAIVIAIAFSIVDEGLSRKKLLGLVLTVCAWANLHITTAIGLGVVASIVIAAAPLTVAGSTLLAGFLATLMTPYLGREWLIFFAATGEVPGLSSIVELRPASITEVPTLFLVLMAGMAGMAATRHRRTCPPLLPAGAAVLVFAGLALTKFLPMALVLLTAIVARALRFSPDDGSGPPGAWEGFQDILRQLESLWEAIPRAALAIALLVGAGLFFVPLWREPIGKSYVPVELADRIVNEDLPQPVLTDFGRGGYLIYRYSDQGGVPRHLVPIDGRSNVIPAERMNQFMNMASGTEDWRMFFDAVDPRTVLFQTDSPLVAILKATGKWCVIGRNPGASPDTALLLRRDEFELRRRNAGRLEAENCT